MRLTFGDAQGPPKDVTVLEPDAPAPLKACMVGALKATSFPRAPVPMNGRYAFPVSFGHP